MTSFKPAFLEGFLFPSCFFLMFQYKSPYTKAEHCLTVSFHECLVDYETFTRLSIGMGVTGWWLNILFRANLLTVCRFCFQAFAFTDYISDSAVFIFSFWISPWHWSLGRGRSSDSLSRSTSPQEERSWVRCCMRHNKGHITSSLE